MKLSKVKLIEIVAGANSAKAYTKISIRDGELTGIDYEFIPLSILPDDLEPGVYSPTFQKMSLDDWIEPSSWLPACIKSEYQWAAMGDDGDWHVFVAKPYADPEEGWMTNGSSRYLEEILKTQPDPLGWENSLHTRTKDGTWVRA